ncbi:hypothetical protein FOYG_08940 [Fusarium oxysporum NRRL 32931]|uniref:Uncharacterized protein n=1 Tax=Fusarium oxysporum NRRL 32931 TaxID=660029 RepID=W9IGS8_FUSOX|nr:hypothetical protein FOYG_08940 [Fusarium oxysporum NRRL 32931]
MEHRTLDIWDQIAPRAYIRLWYCLPYQQTTDLDDLKQHLATALSRLSKSFQVKKGRIFLLADQPGHLAISTNDTKDIPFKFSDQRASFSWTYSQLKSQGFPAKAFVDDSFDLPYRLEEGGKCFAELTKDPKKTLDITIPARLSGESLAAAHVPPVPDLNELLSCFPEYRLLSSPLGPTQFRAQVAGESPGNIGRIFVIQEQTIRDLKDKLTCTRLNASKHQPSTFTCLAAIAWAHATNARIASLSSETSLAEDARLMISVDWRRRISTDSISTSSGNAIALPITSIDKSTILLACNEDEETGYPALAAIAHSIDEAILSVDDDFVAARTALFHKVPDPRFIGLDFDLGGPLDFYLNTWRHFGTRTHWDLPGLYNQDLARGVAPDTVRRAQIGFGTGAGLVLPETDTTKFEVLITLDVEAMEDLCNSTNWQRWVVKPGL